MLRESAAAGSVKERICGSSTVRSLAPKNPRALANRNAGCLFYLSANLQTPHTRDGHVIAGQFFLLPRQTKPCEGVRRIFVEATAPRHPHARRTLAQTPMTPKHWQTTSSW